MRKSYTFGGLAVLFFLLLGITIWYSQDSWMTKGVAERQETPDWAEWKQKLSNPADAANLRYPGTLPELMPGVLLRHVAGENGILLLKHTIGDGVYSFDPDGNKTQKVADDSWLVATGSITVCETQRWSRATAFNMDNMNYRLVSWGESKAIYPTYGKYALDAVISPSKKRAAILSAYGPKYPIINFGPAGLGGGDVKIYGRRYVQVMDLVTKEYIDKPVMLQSAVDLPCFSACWSSDEKILVAYRCDFSDFQVVQPIATH